MKPLFKALMNLLKNQSEFFKEFAFTKVSVEIEYYLAVAPLIPEIFNKKIPKLINKITDPNTKKYCTRILKISSNLGLFLKIKQIYKNLDSNQQEKIQKEFNRNSIHLISSNLPKNYRVEVKKSVFSNLSIDEVT